MPIDIERTTRSHSLKLIASIALVIMAFTGLTSCGGGGGGSGSGSGNQVTIIPLPSPGESLLQGEPDLVVASPSVSDGRPAAGAAFRLSATVSNTGDGESPATTLRFYRSTDATITTADTVVGTDAVGARAPSGAIAQSISLTAPSSPGTYYYGACVDAVTGESDTTTNNCSGSVQVTVPEKQRQGAPDLVVASPSVSDDSPAAGAAFTLSATVRNDGNGASPATTLRFYRSTDATITTADTVVGTDPVSALAAAGTIAQSISLTAPSSPGTYYYGACVDAVTGESDTTTTTTTNNCSGSVQVTVPETQQQGVPDLVVASPSVSPDSPAAGAPLTLSATVRNDGNGASPATTLRFYRSTDATITTADTVVGTDPVSALAAAGTIAQSISLTAPSTPGAYYYGACVDAVTDESDTTNNCSSSIEVTVLVTQQQQGAPDLVVASPSVSDHSPAAGAAFTLSATMRNDGDGDAAATTLRYYRSTDATITTADTVVGTDAVGALAAQGTIAESISLTAPSTPGAYYYGACVDAVTDESDTTNNCSSSTEVTVLVTQQQIQSQPDLEVGTPTVSDDSPATGAPLTLSATVRNDGNGASPATTLRYYRSTDATITTADTAVGTDAVGALAAAGTIAQLISLTAPSSPGTYYYGACVDAVTDESDTDQQLLLGRDGHGHGSATRTGPKHTGPGGAFTQGEQRQPGRRNGLHLLGDGAQRGQLPGNAHVAAVLPLDERDDLDGGHGGGDSRGGRARRSRDQQRVDCADGALELRNVLLRRLRRCGDRRIRHHQQLLVLYSGNRSDNAAAAGRSGPGGGIALGERRHPGRRSGVHAVGDGAERRGRRRCRYNAALLPVAGRDDHDGGHGGGDGRGRRARRSGDHRGVDLADGALEPRPILLRRLRRCGDGRVRHDEQLLVLYSGNRSDNAAAAAGRSGPGGGIALGERRHPGRRGGVHAVGDGAERRGRRRCRYNAALLPVAGRDDHDGGHGGGDGRGRRVGGSGDHRGVDLADGALEHPAHTTTALASLR